MKKNIKILIANPAGNITIFVLDYFEREQYEKVAKQLLAMESLEGEQVAFIKNNNTMEMCGLEFCGNASRSFALINAIKNGIQGHGEITITVSGCDHALTVTVNTTDNYTKIKMPNPVGIDIINNPDTPLLDQCTIVNLDGIVHAIIKDFPPTKENFEVVKNYVNQAYKPPAMGAMFYDTRSDKLTPVVYVKDVDTTYFEGSCGSGSTAVGIAFSLNQSEGIFKYTMEQPAGKLNVTVEKENDLYKNVYIEGPVDISDVINVEIDC